MKAHQLQERLESLILTLSDVNFEVQFRMGLQALVDYKKAGGSQQDIWDKLYPLHMKWVYVEEKHLNEFEQKSDLIGDWLDCICGNVGNRYYSIWGAYKNLGSE